MGDVNAEDVMVVGFLGFLVVAGIGLALSVRRGRALCRDLAQRLPAEYAALGRPLPGFFDSPRRNAYMRLVMQGGFEEFRDPYLVERFRELQRSEVRSLVFLLVGFGVLGAAVLWFEFLRTA